MNSDRDIDMIGTHSRAEGDPAHPFGPVEKPVPGRCPHLPDNTAHVDMCRAQQSMTANNHRETTGFVANDLYQQARWVRYLDKKRQGR